MTSPNFIDHVRLFLRSGKGGAGAVHFRRERFVPKGGPDGGNGGRGGDIILQGNSHLSTLLHLRYRKHIFALNGRRGGKNQCTGADAQDIVVEVPLGTVVKHGDTGEILAEITEMNQRHLLLKGGRGGLGNTHFKSATFQTPRFAQPGEKGMELSAVMELKLMADVGLVGEPNAGKSTLLSVISAAKPKIADYPFTTLVPQLGMVAVDKTQSFVLADIPGLIAGAAEGRGLGIRFLRHIERTKVLLFMVPASAPDLLATYKMLRQELQSYQPTLLKKRSLLAITKIDLLNPEERAQLLATLPPSLDYHLISSRTTEGITLLKHRLWQLIHKE